MGMKLVANRRSTDPMIYRARRMPRLEIRPSGRTRRGYFSSARKGGGVELNPDPYTPGPGNFLIFPGTPIPNFLENKNRVVGLLAPGLRQ